CQHTYDTPYSF
nr:immunoglobulin light chain junction region [Macaca mulatta]